MPTFRHGKSTAVLLNGEDVSTYFNDATTNRSIETVETTAFGQNSKTYIASLRDGTLSLAGMFDGTAGAIDDILAGIAGSNTDNVVTVGVDGGAVGSLCHMVATQETTYEVSSVVSDLVKVSAEFQADGGLDSGRLLASSAVIASATTTNGTAVDNAAASSNGGVGHVHATANTQNATTAVKIQHSTDNSTWVDLVTFTAIGISTKSAQRIEVAAGTTVNRYLRSQVVTTGTGSITTSVAFARR